MTLVFLAFVLALDGASTCNQSTGFTAISARANDPALPLVEREAAYHKAINDCPQDPVQYRQLALLLLGNRKYQEALRVSNQGLAIAGADPGLLLQKVMALLPLGRPKDALETLQRLQSGQSYFYKGIAYRQLRNTEKSRDNFVHSWDLGYRDPYVLYSIIEDDYDLGDKQNGLGYFQLLLKEYPNSAWEHLLMADAYFAKDNNRMARTEYLKALEMKPDLLEANFRLGYIAFQNGDDESAIAYFRHELVCNPAYVDAHTFLAEALLHQDQKEEALIQLREALSLDGNSQLVYKRLATTLIETRHLNEAKATLGNAEKRFPDDPAFPAQLARVLTLLHDSKGAAEQAFRARELTAQQHRKQDIVPDK